MQRNRTLSEPIVRQRPVNPPPDPEQPIMETPMAPNALALSSSYLLTNGTHNDELILWDLQQGKYLDTLSESKALSRYGLHIPPYRKARFAEFTPDHTCIYTSVEFDSTFGLLIWDYSNQCRIRKIVKRSLPTEDVCDVWICIDSGL
ncbi:hypothetical protein EDD86DRAFT_190841 [Gorgonomyces haynaldii]|nr:hypothetical protein EDD86DRAFT_190841 [Gorgonomyces haynaldii]